MANNIDIIQLTKYDGTPFYPLVDINSVAGLSTRLNTIGYDISALQSGLSSAQGSITTLQGYFDANGKVNYANLPSLYIGNATVQSSAQTGQNIGGLGNLTPGGISATKNLGSSTSEWATLYCANGEFGGDVNVGETLQVSGYTYLMGELEVDGEIYLNDVLYAYHGLEVGNQSAQGYVNVYGYLTINGPIYNPTDDGIYFGPDENANIFWSPSENELYIAGSNINFDGSALENVSWEGSTIPVIRGGTGKTSWTTNGVLYASAATTLAQVANVTGNSQKKFLVQTTNASGTAQAPAWGGIDQRDVLGTSDIGSTSLPVYYKGASNYALAPITDLDLLGQTANHGYVKAKRFYLSNDVYFEWIAPTSTTDGYVKLNAPLLTTGDQIVGSGTPGGGGGGGSIPFLTDLQDVIQGIQPTANKMLIWTSQGTNNAGTTGGWTLIDKSSVGVTTDATQSAHGLMSTADKIKLDSIKFGTQASDYIPITIGSTTKNVLTAHQSLASYATQNWVTQQITNLNLGTASTYSVGSVASGNTGLVTGGAVWTAIDNLPEPMVFKGSLGTGGTITTLPAASSANEGYTYKVITAGTYASKTAKVGDTFISTGSEWVLIPSGDEPEGTVTSVGLTVPTGLSVTGSPITSSGTLAITFASGYSIPTTANQTAWSNKYDKPSGGIPATDLASAVQTNITNGATAYGYFSSGVLPVSHGGTGKDTLTSGSALIGNGTSAVTLRAITNNTTATAVTASTNLITANTLYYHKGNSNIVTVGTISSGTWQGTPIENDYLAHSSITVGSTVFNLGDTKTSLAGLVNVTMTGTLKVGDAEITWDGTNGYLKINKPLLTVGDQIVGSGTPSSGGGGGAGFLYELGDVLTDSDHTVVKQYDGTTNAANNNLFAFNGSKWYALKLGTNLAITNGTLNATNTTYSNGTGLALSNGVFSITSAYQTDIANGASAYSTLTTSQAKNKVLASPSNASGAPSFRALVAADLPSIENLTNFSTRVYDATTSRTANYVLAAPNGSNGAATFRKLVAADIPSLTVSKISDIASNYVSIATANTITAKHTFSNGILLNTASSWTSSDRAIAFSADGEDANIRYYNTDSNKGLTFNPNTGELKAAKFIKRGGTSDQFLKADGSTDSKTYLTSHQALYNLVINNSAGVAQITYKPGTSGTYSLTLTKTMVGLGNVDNLAASDYFTAISSTTSTPLSITVGGTTKTLSSLYATTAERPRNISGTAEAGGYNLNTILAGGGAIRNVSSSSYWAHAPQGLGYFGVAIQVNPTNLELGAMQFAYNMNYNGTTPTDKIWWRARNNDGWADDWHLIYDSATLTKSVITGLLGSTTYASYHPDGYLPLSGGTMTGSIKLPNGSYINAESGYTMLGIGSGGETFYCGPGAEITNAFYLRSGNINLTHVKAGTNYTIWDASNSNLSTVDWAANNLTVAGTSTFSDTMYVENRKYMQWKDSGGTSRNVFGLNNSNELLIGYGLSSVTGSTTALYGDTIRISASSMTELVKTGGGATLMFRGSALNNAPGTILFRGGTAESNGFKIEAEPYGTYGRVSLSFYTSNVSSGDAPYTPDWKRSMRIYYNGNIHFGSDGAFYPTVYSYGPIVIGTTTNNANLTVRGTITSTGDQVISSDATLKTNWRELNYTVKDVANVKIGIFDWKDGHGTSAGSVAQDWKKLIPELVHGDEGNMTLAYGQIALLNTVLLARRSEDHETRIKALELENAELRKEIERLKS